jgi:hypothetical protein
MALLLRASSADAQDLWIGPPDDGGRGLPVAETVLLADNLELDGELPLPAGPQLPSDSSAGAQAGGAPGETAADNSALPLRPPPSPTREERVPSPVAQEPQYAEDGWILETPWQVPSGYAGPSGILPLEEQTDSHFVPVPDRWRIGFPPWDRYGPDHSVLCPHDPFEEDAPYTRGNCWNPYRQNVLKGDYPILGQHTFLNLSVTSFTDVEFRQVPTPTTPFESTEDPFQEEFFGDPDQFFFNQDLKLTFDLVHGDAGFKQPDWRLKLTPVFNANYLAVEELGVVSPDVRFGKTRFRQYQAIEEAFVETKLMDTSPYFDFTSLRVGSQPFVSDFRGFIFADINNAARIFGTRNANRDQFNLILFDQREKETNSALNSYDDRTQNTFIANYYRQDFIWPGYTAQASLHYNQDRGHNLVFDRNGFLARPDPVGVFEPHDVDSVYFGWAGDGHINIYILRQEFFCVV